MSLELIPTMDTQLTYGFDRSQMEELARPLSQAAIKERPGPGGKPLKYISGKIAIDTANRIFGVGKWGYRVLSRSCEKSMNLTGEITGIFYTADIELYVMGCPFPFPGEGVGIVVPAKAGIIPECHEKARKEAVTDALKRALRHYGDQFGLALYDEESLVEDEDGNLTKVKDVHPQQNGKPQQPQAKKTVDASPTIAQLKVLCEEVLGPNKWGALRGRVLNPEEIGDVPDDMLSIAQKARIHGALVAHQRQKQAAKAAASTGGK